MSCIELLAKTRPIENAGSRSSNRFDYQINWGLQKLLRLEENDEDYIMILDYHDDIVICSSDKQSDFIDFYQVKTKKAGQWNLSALNGSANYLGDGDSEHKEDGLSILSKLLKHTKTFSNSRNLFFVTNSSLSKRVFSRSDDYVQFNQLTDSARTFIKKIINKELGDIEDSAFEKLVFIQNQMSIGSFKETLLGTLSQFLKNKFNLVTDVNAVYDTLISELRKRNDYENEIKSPEDLVKHKSITHKEFSGYLNNLTIQKEFEELKKSILDEIDVDVRFAEKHKITESLNTIFQDSLNYENDELWNLRSEIRNKMSVTDISDDLKGLWDYANKIFVALMSTYNNYKQHSDVYIKSLILYVYVQDNQRIV
ncbi:MAG: DUF4297 domain-containing protein [Bacteroidaceae bacterium]|nr:DUF4297 domain-containing protein [Bacteroidaceae bacterium]